MIKDMLQLADVDFVAKAPDGKEVEELTKKELHKALRSKITAEQANLEMGNGKPSTDKSTIARKPQFTKRYERPVSRPPARPVVRKTYLPTEIKTKFKNMLNDLIGTRGAYILDEKLNILGKVPISELATTVKSLSSGIYAIVFDGLIEKSLVEIAEKSRVKYLVAMNTKIQTSETRVNILTNEDL